MKYGIPILMATLCFGTSACIDWNIKCIDKDGDHYCDCVKANIEESRKYSCDCDDTDAKINKGSFEVCDNLDNDCDGKIDEGLGTQWFLDNDNDGYGDEDTVECAGLAKGEAYVERSGDCDDDDPNNFPTNEEVCDEKDNDCDEEIDEGLTEGITYYPDKDYDGYPWLEGVPQYFCEDKVGFASSELPADCDDTQLTIHPGAPEIFCNEIDEDCDGVDECSGDFTPQGAIEIRTNQKDEAEDIGASLAILGDLCDKDCAKEPENADLIGLQTLVVSAPLSDINEDDGTKRRNAGAVHVLWVDPTQPPAMIDVDQYTFGAHYYHLVIQGADAQEQLGTTLTSGDLDGDGLQDLIIGTPHSNHRRASGKSGAVFIYLGRTLQNMIMESEVARQDRIEISLDGNSASPKIAEQRADMIIYRAALQTDFGSSLLAIDLNEDGFQDLVIGAPNDNKGSVTLVYGGPDGMTFSNVSDTPQQLWGEEWLFQGHSSDMVYEGLNGDLVNQRLIAGQNDNEIGYALTAIGSFFGESSTQWVTGAPSNKVESKVRGQSFMFSTDIRVSSDDAHDAPWIFDPVHHDAFTNQRFGHTVSGIGDINCDGYDDLAVSAPLFDEQRGRIYIVFGDKEDTFSKSQSIEDIASLTLTGSEKKHRLGDRISPLGDLNGDACDDFAVSTPLKSFKDGSSFAENAGETHILFGRVTGEWETIAAKMVDDMGQPQTDWEALDKIRSAQSRDRNARFGTAIVSADIDKDGFGDFMVSATGANGTSTSQGRGAVYVHLSGASAP